MTNSMFERYGGFAKISQLVSLFYDRVLDSPVASPYFANTDMRRQVDHQTKFVSTLMGGPASYTDDALERVHSTLGITDAAFDAVTMLLRETLEDFGIDEADVRVLCEEFVSRRRYIVKR